MLATEQKQTRMRARHHLESAWIRTTAAHEMTCCKFWTELNYYEWHKLLAKRRYKEATDSVKHFSSVLLVDIVWCMRSTLSYNVVRRHSEELFGNRQCLHLCLYNTGISWAIIDVFSWDKTIQDVYLRRGHMIVLDFICWHQWSKKLLIRDGLLSKCIPTIDIYSCIMLVLIAHTFDQLVYALVSSS